MHFGRETSLVVGADGFLGRNLSRWFDARGHRWFGIGRSAGDLSEPEVAEAAFAALPKVDRVFHLVTRQRTGPIQFGIQGELLRINSLLHINVLEAWRKHQPQAKLISMGSSCTYPESNQPLAEERFGEGPTHPSVYGYAHGKLTIATGSQAYGQQYGLKWLHCVLATMFGPMDNKADDRSHFMGAMIDRAWRERNAGAKAFTVWGKLDTVRELLYVDDQIEAILAADAVFDDRIINCAANAPVTVREAADAVLSGMYWSAPIVSQSGSFQGADYKVLASDVFLTATGWRPKMSLVAGVRRVLEEEYNC